MCSSFADVLTKSLDDEDKDAFVGRGQHVITAATVYLWFWTTINKID